MNCRLLATPAWEEPAAGATDTPYGNVPPPVTVSGIVVVALSAPLTPFTGNAYDPAATPGLILMDTPALAMVGFGANVPVIPEGHPAAESVTAELNPLDGDTVTVAETVEPIAPEALPAVNVNPGAAEPVRVRVPS